MDRSILGVSSHFKSVRIRNGSNFGICDRGDALMKRYRQTFAMIAGLFVLLAILVTVMRLPSSDETEKQWNLAKVVVSGSEVIEEVEQDSTAMSLIRQIRSLDYRFVSNIGPGFLWVIVDDDELSALHEGGNDVELIMKGRERDLFKRMVWGPRMELPAGYHTYNEIIDELRRINHRFADITSMESMGKTQRYGKDIYAIKISDNALTREDEPKVLFSAAIHGNEIMGTEMCLALIDELVSDYGRVDTITRAVDGLEIWFVPVINVDGYSIATTDHPMWRKNARDNDGDGRLSDDDGVDLNRNFDFHFESSGSNDPASRYYRGPAPLSEGETRAMAAFVEREKFLFSITYHSAEARVYYPWLITHQGEETYSPEDALLTDMAEAIAGRIRCLNDDFNYEAVRNTCDDAYTTNYYYGVLGTIDFMVEMGKYDHVYPEQVLERIIENNMPGARYLLARAHGPGLTGVVTDYETGEPVRAKVRILPFDTKGITPRTTDSETGRYYRALQPGEYSVEIEAEGMSVARVDGVRVGDKGWTVLDVLLNKREGG